MALTAVAFACAVPLAGRRRRSRPPPTASLSSLGAGAAAQSADRATSAAAGKDRVLTFSAADFAVSDRVSVGLQGRPDELIFEATVRDPSSSLYGSTVVLRQLSSLQAKRRGRRALEVLKKLARRQLLYHSYVMQVHGYVVPGKMDDGPFTLVHAYHGSYSLRHWLQLSDWLPILEATLALDEEHVRKVGDDKIGGPAVTRQLRLTRVLMRDLLIGVNYLHSHGLAHTELRLENVHISPVDKHIKVGILGNAVDFDDKKSDENTAENSSDRKGLMIAFDMRCIGFIMAKMIMTELMDSSIFARFKSFLTQGNDPSCLREFLLPILTKNSPSGNVGLQILDRNWGAGWNLLSLLLATKPSDRISCLNALRHPFLCGPRWRVNPSMDVSRWGLGSTAVRMAEDYIYGHSQRKRIAYFLELMELLNPNPRPQSWFGLMPGRWRLLYCTGRHIGLTLRQPRTRVLISNVFLFLTQDSESGASFSISTEVHFKVMPNGLWPHNKSGDPGCLTVRSSVRLSTGRIFFQDSLGDKAAVESSSMTPHKNKQRKAGSLSSLKGLASDLPVVKIKIGELDMSMSCSPALGVDAAQGVLREIRTLIPPETFDPSMLVCGSYIDSRLMILRSVNGSALFFTRSSPGWHL